MPPPKKKKNAGTGQKVSFFQNTEIRNFYVKYLKLPSIARHVNTSTGVIQPTSTIFHLMIVLLLLLLSRFSRVRLCEIPWTAAHQAPPSTGFSGQEYWSGLPFPSPHDSVSLTYSFNRQAWLHGANLAPHTLLGMGTTTESQSVEENSTRT